MFTHEMIKSFNQLEMDVYNYIISNEEKVVYMKVRELAEEVHVSTTTILRFCKKVGCEGYSEFRLKLKQEVSSKEKKIPANLLYCVPIDTADVRSYRYNYWVAVLQALYSRYSLLCEYVERVPEGS